MGITSAASAHYHHAELLELLELLVTVTDWVELAVWPPLSVTVSVTL